jgi:hypothetical protein
MAEPFEEVLQMRFIKRIISREMLIIIGESNEARFRV